MLQVRIAPLDPGAADFTGSIAYHARVLRLVGFFLVVLAALEVLRHVPVVGSIFRIPLLGFYLAAIVVAALASRLTAAALDRRKQRDLERRLGSVDTPHNKGKLGQLLLSQGHHRRAIPLLEEAAVGEPEVTDWHYRLGRSYLLIKRPEDAIAALQRAVAIDEEHAYGAALLRLAEALTEAGRFDEALAAAERFERNHGPSPESASRRGHALAGAGEGERARAAFAEVAPLASQAAKYQRKSASSWVVRAWWARLATR